ncbi:hypothetical protein TNCV_2961531 [Trichonephila clavipes]|nr:hypothetical protein TNCV_2961531 [Trichonephila clavipes]
MRSSLVPLKIRRVGVRCKLNLSRLHRLPVGMMWKLGERVLVQGNHYGSFSLVSRNACYNRKYQTSTNADSFSRQVILQEAWYWNEKGKLAHASKLSLLPFKTRPRCTGCGRDG